MGENRNLKSPQNGRGHMLAGEGKTEGKIQEAQGDQKMLKALQSSGRRCPGLEQ